MKSTMIRFAFAAGAALAAILSASPGQCRAGHHRRPGEGAGQRRRMADVRPRLSQLALQPARRDHAGQRRQARARLGDVDRRPVRRPRGDAAVPRRRALLLGRLCARVRGRRQVRQHRLALRARIRGRLQRHALLRPDPSRPGAEGRSRLSSTRLDAKLVALNRADGKVVWEAKIDDWKNGVTTNSAPLVVEDHVIIGVSGGEYGVRGYLKSFNAKTGALEWQTYTIPAPGEPGSETWPKDDSWKTGGGPTWLTGSYDADTNTLYWGVGNPGSWQSEPAPGRQSLDRLDARARSRHRQDQVGLPVHAERCLGLRRHGDADPGRRHDRRQADARRGRSPTATASSTSSTAPTVSSSMPCRWSTASTGRPASIPRPASRPSTRR